MPWLLRHYIHLWSPNNVFPCQYTMNFIQWQSCLEMLTQNHVHIQMYILMISWSFHSNLIACQPWTTSWLPSIKYSLTSQHLIVNRSPEQNIFFSTLQNMLVEHKGHQLCLNNLFPRNPRRMANPSKHHCPTPDPLAHSSASPTIYSRCRRFIKPRYGWFLDMP